MTNPEQDDRQAEAFGRWCDHAQIVIALRELYSASRISFDDLLTLAAHTMSESSELIWTDASSERMCDKAWAPEIEAVRDTLWENFERETDPEGYAMRQANLRRLRTLQSLRAFVGGDA